ncbi:MAG: hypothetical protein ACXACC_01730 [Promethearchaeota archaeon]
MAHFMATLIYPTESAQDIGKKFTSGALPKLPDFVKQLYIFVATAGDIKTYSLYEVPDDKKHEGFKAINNRYAGYFGIKGFKYTLEPLLTSREALPMIGLG